MTKKEKSRLARLSSPFSTGAGGTAFEYRVQATFLLSLLVKSFSPMTNFPIKALQFQSKRSKHNLDDITVIAEQDGEKIKFQCQIKHKVSISANNKVFKEIMVAAWADFNSLEFKRDTDKLVLITGFSPKIDTLRFLHDQANSAEDARDFIDRIQEPNYSNDDNRKKLQVLKTCLKAANNDQEISDDVLWAFCKVFTVLVFDMDYECSVNEFLIQSLIASNTQQKASLVWGRLIQYATSCNRAASYVEYDRLPADVIELFKNTEQSPPSSIVDFKTDVFWAKLVLIGSWNEKNDFDKQFVSTYLNMPYSDIQQKVQNESLLPEPKISYEDGIWTVNHRRFLVGSSSKFYFDDTVEPLFKFSVEVFSQKDARISTTNYRKSIFQNEKSFSHSDNLRNGVVHGLAMLCNLPQEELSCTDGFIDYCSRSFIKNIFTESDATTWISLESHLATLAEIHPEEYLHILEKTVLESPKQIEVLFPKKEENLLFSQGSIAYVLWSLEVLAWNTKYFNKCIRVLGSLAGLNFEKTNFANTPTNTIVSIILPWYPQTLATSEKQKNAMKSLQEDYPDIAWKVIKKLLPNITTSTTGTNKPHYMNIDIPKEISVTSKEVFVLQQYYSSLAVQIAKQDPKKLKALLPYLRNMDRQTVKEFFDIIEQNCSNWDDGYKYVVWNELSNTATWLSHQENTPVDSEVLEWFNSSIEKIIPNDIRYRNRRVYEAHCFDYEEDFEFGQSKWEARKNRKTHSVLEIYNHYGIHEVIRFGKEMDKLREVSVDLGRGLSAAQVDVLLNSCLKGEIERNFLSAVLSGFFSIDTNNVEDLEILIFPQEYIAWILSCMRPSKEVFDIVEDMLMEDATLYWGKVEISGYGLDLNGHESIAWRKLIECERFTAAINLFRFDSGKNLPSSADIQEALIKASVENSKERLEPEAVRNLIKVLQEAQSPDIKKLSEIEWVYLPWLDEYSEVKSKAIRYRLANDAGYFCDLISLMYKRKSANTHDKKLAKPVTTRLFQLFFQFSVVPGTSWEGNVDQNVFTSWMEAVTNWGKENDRIEVILHTIGNGLSYAKRNENGLMDDFLLKELNAIENEELRRGYYLGIKNQRGVVTLDPEGKPELKLSEQYKQLADTAEELGYGRLSELLQSISDSYREEAKMNKKSYLKKQRYLAYNEEE